MVLICLQASVSQVLSGLHTTSISSVDTTGWVLWRLGWLKVPTGDVYMRYSIMVPLVTPLLNARFAALGSAVPRCAPPVHAC